MADNYCNVETLKFIMHDVHDMESVLKADRYQDFDAESVNFILDSAKDLGDQEFFPYYQEMDEKPAEYKDGEIIVHPQIKKVDKVSHATTN